MSERYTLILVRHTQTDDNAARRYSGARERAHLTTLGMCQAATLATKLQIYGNKQHQAHKHFTPITLFSSDLERTLHVAAMISHLHEGVPIIPDKRLREVDVGQMGGVTKQDALTRFPGPHFRTEHANWDYTSIGGEDKITVRQRLRAFVEDLPTHPFRPRDSKHIIVVSHGTALRTLLEHYGCHDPLHEQGHFQTLEVNL